MNKNKNQMTKEKTDFIGYLGTLALSIIGICVLYFLIRIIGEKSGLLTSYAMKSEYYYESDINDLKEEQIELKENWRKIQKELEKVQK